MKASSFLAAMSAFSALPRASAFSLCPAVGMQGASWSLQIFSTQNFVSKTKLAVATSGWDFTDQEEESTFESSAVNPLLKSYEYDGWNLKYQFKPASKGFEKESPILLVHPVGIGMSSWFWEKMMNSWNGPALVAVDLIGCGIKHGADAWDPNERDLSVPLGWVKACEALMQIVGAEMASSNKQSIFPFPSQGGIFGKKYSVVVQGGLAPVGVLLAARNPETVQKLVLTSPPVWKEMTTGVPEKELQKNYEFLSSPIFGPLAFGLLESQWAVRFFSNLFLFSEPCDEQWLKEVENEACSDARPPVQVFNAGFCIHRSFEEELRTLPQPTLILQGADDEARIPDRASYSNTMQHCTLQVMEGKNVLPWENPKKVGQAIQNFLKG